MGRVVKVNQLYLPPLSLSSIGIPNLGRGTYSFVAAPTTQTVTADLLGLIVNSIKLPSPTSAAVEIEQSCSSLLENASSGLSESSISSTVPAAVDCLKSAFKDSGILSDLENFLTLFTRGSSLGSLSADLIEGLTVDIGLRQFSVTENA
jgi:hypothetical protein